MTESRTARVRGSEESAKPVLEVRGLTLTTSGGAEVVGDVSFSIGPGEILSIVGESGSGKTAVALALMGHTRPGMHVSGGTVRVGGKDILCHS